MKQTHTFSHTTEQAVFGLLERIGIVALVIVVTLFTMA
ncbi:hypothetical protein VCR4J2_750429 [Vibrio coralliirubri]|nr:hypothetical protein VCR4J2_750429 [Vibrio coralliirubri]